VTEESVTSLHDFTAATITGQTQKLSEYAGKVALVVNVASECGFTGQYAGLEELYETYADRGLVVLGFPCDQFGGQEPGTEAEIAEFCTTTFGVSFPLFAKIDVNGDYAHPLYSWLRNEQPGQQGDAIEWNFTKFLVSPSGRAVQRYGPADEPDTIASDIEPLLP
jgi:glutathione peroxidase